ATKYRVRGCRSDQRLPRHLVEWKNVKKPNVDEQVDDRDGQNSTEHRAWDVARRITQLSREIDYPVVAIVGENHGLHRQYERRQERESRGRLRCAAANAAPEHETRADQNRKRQRLQKRGKVLSE